MLGTRVFSRFFHLHTSCWVAEKSLLATLRKKTGYTFTNCKKALEIHNNDVIQAELWLKEQAQALGWSKATKLEGRQTTQGLIGVVVHLNNAALVEVNCETDFVAKNKEFHKIVQEAALSCLNFTQQQPPIISPLTQIPLNGEQIKNLRGHDSKLLSDHLALMIGAVGENASFKRALCFKAQDGVHLSGYAHPSSTKQRDVLLGRLGAVVALTGQPGADIDKIGKEICQHIVGLNPRKIGSSEDKPAKDKEEETCLIHQEFLLDDEVTVGEVLKQNGVEVVDFKRFACGENTSEVPDQFEYIETCQ